MNKTVNINLAGIFFHIDEDAYAKLQHYLDAIKRSLSGTNGRDEIINDIEARIAELFSEKIQNERQVIGTKEVEEVISVMGQPEDYMLDEELFEDEPSYTKSKGKKLFRDTEHSYIGGVSSGLGHFLGINAIWLRLAWILLTIFSTGAFILIYIALWIFVPEAKTTADKLAMRGEPVTISNIERKIREGFEDVSGKMKDIDYEKYGYSARKGANSAATAVGDGISFLLNLFVKFIGILLLLIAGTTLIGLFIGFFTVGTFGIIEAPWMEWVDMVGPGQENIWVISILAFLAIGIPFFFLFILGLKILVKKLKSIGTTAKLVLLGLWIISVLGLIFFGIKQATERAYDADVVITETLPVKANDTLYLKMEGNPVLNSTPYRSGKFNYSLDENDQKVLWSQDIRLVVKSTSDSLGRIEIQKTAEGKNYEDARARAEKINYTTSFSGNELKLGGQLTTAPENKHRDQEVQVTLFLPEGTILYADDNTYSFHRNSDWYNDILENGKEERYLLITKNGTECLDCPEGEDSWEDSDEEWLEDDDDEINARINVDGKEINVKIDKKGVKVQDEKNEEIMKINSSNI